MAADYWKASEDIYEMMKGLVANNHPDLVLAVDDIAIVFKEKAGKSGGRAVLGAARKVAPIANALSDKSYKFVLEIGADLWEHGLTGRQREALLDHLLSACHGDEDENSGEMKWSVVKPDITAFRGNVERYGLWFPSEEENDEAATNALEEMFSS
jgi:hypothetical protein